MAARDDYSRLILAELGNLNPSQDIKDWLTGWGMNETGGSPRPAHNPLSCGLAMPGSSMFNCVRGCPTHAPCPSCELAVQNYVNEAEGATAIALNLQEPHDGYHDIVVALQSEDRVALGITGTPGDGVKRGLTTWGTGAGGATSFAANGAIHRNDDYDTGASSGTFTPQTTTTTTYDCKKYPCSQGCNDFWACLNCRLANPVTIGGPSPCWDPNDKSSSSQTITSGPGGADWLNSLLSKGTNLLKFIAGLAAFALGLGLIYEILSQQPVVSSAVSKASQALKVAAA